MKGIILLSHGTMAEGLFETSKWFMGDDIPQYTYLCLGNDESPEEFDKRIKSCIEEVDTGEGAILMVDLLNGTPCNRSCYFINDNVQAISGMNLAMVLEQLGNRLTGVYDINSLIETSRNGIVSINQLMSSSNEDNDELF